MKRTLSSILLTAAVGLAHADGSGSAVSKKIPEEQPVPTTPLIIAGVALAGFAILLLVGRRKKSQRAATQPHAPSDLAEVRLVIETDESATVSTASGLRVSTDRLGEAVLHLPIGNHQIVVDVGSETFQRTIEVPSIRRMRMPINLTKERISRAASGKVPVVPRPEAPRTSAARAFPDAATQGELGDKLAGLIDVELDRPAKAPTKAPPLNLDFSAIPAAPPSPVPPPPAAVPAPALELDVDEDLDLQLPSLPNVPATTLELPPQPARGSALAGAPASAPAERPNPLRDVVIPPRVKTPSMPPRVTKAERQEAANAVADFAVDELVTTAPAELSIGPVPEIDLAPQISRARPEEPRSFLDIGDFALGELAQPAPIEVELPAVTAASVAELELDLPIRAPEPRGPAKPTPSIDDFELTPDPAAPPRPPIARASRPSVQAPSRPSGLSSPTLGTIANRYRKTGGAGAGMLGALYRGRDESSERDVWIEELPREVSIAVPPATLAKLEHPNLLRFYDHVAEGPTSYVISELVEGKSLEQVLNERGGSLPSLEAIAIVDQVCAGLGYAHQQGVFHRSVRPACVWISGRNAKLTGFGLGLGRPSPYQAPELAAGADPDVRSELYSVGILLAQLLSGTVPGAGNVELPSDMPRSLAGMMRKLISREPMIRPATIKVVRDAFSAMF